MVRKVLEKKITVAIYSGIIPSTTFIENLIKLIANNNFQIFLFGVGKKIDYKSKFIKTIIIPKNKIGKIVFLISNLTQLVCLQPRKAIKLFKNHKIFTESNAPLNSLIKILPVLNYTPDIFHIQWAKSLPFWFFLKKIFGVRIILSLRGSHINYSADTDKTLFEEYKTLFPVVDKMHAVSNTIKLNAIRFGAKRKNIKVIHSSLNIDCLKKFRKTCFDVEKTFRFLSVGRFHWVKGYKYCLDAIFELKSEGENIEYSIISQGDISEELLYQISDLSLEKEVKIISSNSQESIYKKMKESDCLILSSVDEGISNVVLESMAIGLPVISSDCGGMKEIITDGVNGSIFQSRDSKSLILMLKRFMNAGIEKRKKYSDSGIKFIQENFDSEAIKAELQDLYIDAIRNRNCELD